jgi:hypothetical protein
MWASLKSKLEPVVLREWNDFLDMTRFSQGIGTDKTFAYRVAVNWRYYCVNYVVVLLIAHLFASYVQSFSAHFKEFLTY